METQCLAGSWIIKSNLTQMDEILGRYAISRVKESDWRRAV